jgi:hypothetical protein
MELYARRSWRQAAVGTDGARLGLGIGLGLETRMMLTKRCVLIGLAGLALVGCGPAAPSASPSPIVTIATATTKTAAAPSTASTGPAFSLDPNYSGYETLDVGLGGSQCTIDTQMRTFAPDDPVRVNANYTPSLPAGTTVTIHLTRDGIEVPGYPVTVTYETATNCVYGDVSPGTLPPGRYRWEAVPDSAPTIAAEFYTE